MITVTLKEVKEYTSKLQEMGTDLSKYILVLHPSEEIDADIYLLVEVVVDVRQQPGGRTLMEKHGYHQWTPHEHDEQGNCIL